MTDKKEHTPPLTLSSISTILQSTKPGEKTMSPKRRYNYDTVYVTKENNKFK